MLYPWQNAMADDSCVYYILWGEKLRIVTSYPCEFIEELEFHGLFANLCFSLVFVIQPMNRIGRNPHITHTSTIGMNFILFPDTIKYLKKNYTLAVNMLRIIRR